MARALGVLCDHRRARGALRALGTQGSVTKDLHPTQSCAQLVQATAPSIFAQFLKTSYMLQKLNL